ncbi:MAG: glycosyltransferase [Xanthomonadales bacterium]|nr:glycosyltransferase [Xanthomonadales bacterium]
MLDIERVRQHYNEQAPDLAVWRVRNAYYYAQLTKLVRFLVPTPGRVLELGCGRGDLLAALRPESGVGIDISEKMIELARDRHADDPDLRFEVADAQVWSEDGSAFDYVVLANLIGDLPDVFACFRNLHEHCHDRTRIIIAYYNALWEPVLNLGESLGLKMPQRYQNWLSLADIENLLDLTGFDVVKQGHELLWPKRFPVVDTLLNRYLARLPIVRKLNLITYLVARPNPAFRPNTRRERSVTVVVPCRNERGNIKDAVRRIPAMGRHTEILFVDGNSNDGTVEEIERVMAAHPDRDIKLLHQVPPGDSDGLGHDRMLRRGKGDAVRKGFNAASGEILMILDADLTVLPEELPMFYDVIVEGPGRLVNGSRMVYPMETDAMRTLNKFANRCFGLLFSWLLEQRIRDTLCGTKVLFRSDYDEIAAGRDWFGDFDPCGDFDLLFGAARSSLRIIDLPVHYANRTYGDIKIQRFKHGLMLLRMSVIAMRRLKFH